MVDRPTRGAQTSAGIEVAGPGAVARLAGPGTGRPTTESVVPRSLARIPPPGGFPVPNGREEDWRFTPLDRLRGLHQDPVPDAKTDLDVDAAPGVVVGPLERDDPRVGRSFVPTDRVAQTALAGFTDGTVVSIGPDARTDRPTTLTIHGQGGTVLGHVLVEVAPGAEAVLVLDHVGSASYAANVEVVVGDGAALTLVSLQNWNRDAVHVGQHAFRLGRDARLTTAALTLGGDLVRLVPTVEFTGSGGEADLFGLYLANSGQHLEHRLFVDHAVPHCRSEVAYKGAIQGADAHAVWVGDVLIRNAAVGTDTYELNRNLLLTDGARADSVPNLEIETGEVIRAGHASATGRFDDEQLFYLMSRGITADEARRLVVRGFFADLLHRLAVPQIAERVQRAIEAELTAVLG
jgi:Fe-S cluster assembly protein SufD